MKNQILFSLFLLGCLYLMVSPILAQQQTLRDELSYSASMCTTPTAIGFEGVNGRGLRWDRLGFWANNNTENQLTLICPVPLNRSELANGNFGTIAIQVHVYDGNNSEELTVELYGRPAMSEQLDASRETLASGVTPNTFTGPAEVDLRASLDQYPDVRYLWLNIDVPSMSASDRQSAVLGYSVALESN